jgi:hypothetical protein
MREARGGEMRNLQRRGARHHHFLPAIINAFEG